MRSSRASAASYSSSPLKQARPSPRPYTTTLQPTSPPFSSKQDPPLAPAPPTYQACRTEAEYAFQQRKRIVPIIMEAGYKPSGWLGALMGTRLYFDMSDVNRVPSKAPSLVKVRARLSGVTYRCVWG